MREIINHDIKKIQKLSLKILKDDQFQSIERLGGMTNHSYHVRTAKHDLVFRLPGDGTEGIINRENEIVANRLASALNIDTQILYIDTSGQKITPYIQDAITMDPFSMRRIDNIQLAAQVFKTLHQCQVNTHIPFDVAGTAREYEKCIEANEVAFFDDYAVYKEIFLDLQQQFHLADEQLVPCHNDPLCENWIRSNDRMYLIDWEYAGMNDPLWDLADLSIEADYNHEQDHTLLYHYFQFEPTAEIWQRFFANKVFIDYLWSLWGLARIPYDPSMLTYGQERYARMKKNLELVKQA